MSCIQTSADTRNISIHPISLEELAAWDHVSVVEETSRVDALKEMYRVYAREDQTNLVLWQDPKNPARRELPEDILAGWQNDIYVESRRIGLAVADMDNQISRALATAADPKLRRNNKVFTDYTQDFVYDLERAFPHSHLRMNAFTDLTRDSMLTHSDDGSANLVRFLAALYGNRTFFARNEDVDEGEYGWNFKPTVDRRWYEPPEGLVTLPAKETQKDVPILHTTPFSHDPVGQKERYVLIADVLRPEL